MSVQTCLCFSCYTCIWYRHYCLLLADKLSCMFSGYENLVIFFLYFMGQEFGQGSVGWSFSSMWWLGSLSGFQLADGLGCMWGGPGYLCCHVWCLAGGGWKAELNWHLFSPWSPRPHRVVCLLEVRLLSRWLKTLRECSKETQEKLWGIWRANLREPWVSLLPHSVVRQVTGPVQSQEEGNENFLLNGGQLQLATDVFQSHGFSHGALELGASLFLWEAVNMSLYC